MPRPIAKPTDRRRLSLVVAPERLHERGLRGPPSTSPRRAGAVALFAGRLHSETSVRHRADFFPSYRSRSRDFSQIFCPARGGPHRRFRLRFWAYSIGNRGAPIVPAPVSTLRRAGHPKASRAHRNATPTFRASAKSQRHRRVSLFAGTTSGRATAAHRLLRWPQLTKKPTE
jgi:hypothetical protein